ncbi:MAG TPA: carboxypeptidase-like regulatory domain-containing protein, partial [Prolixibacteraceae bacterium]|nr:carboxypeptidase-like regulatory domain-containing protein [Prolixibacteraceae bacterium]
MLGVLLLSGVVLTAQTVNVRGKVTDSASGMGIPGANVLVKGTTMGTVTDIDGGFALDVPVNGTLVVSFI